ncbi:MAG TPA: cupredoxin domain-containing protein [Solirubrobacteraceae bacterium]|nr:cupredoxin domain-containing protein [Solirubrobacteraceae bacterium]
MLVASIGGLCAVGLSACSEDDVIGENADEQVEVSLREYDITPSRVRVTSGDIEIEAENNGERLHELAVTTDDGVETTGEIKAGETGSVTVNLPDGTYRMYDPRSDYRDRGMSATLVVESDRATVTERTVERTVIEEQPDVDEPEVQEPEVQEPAPAPAPPPPPPARTVTQVVPAPPPAEEPPAP